MIFSPIKEGFGAKVKIWKEKESYTGGGAPREKTMRSVKISDWGISKKIDFLPHLSLTPSWSHGKGGCCNGSGCDLWVWPVFVIYGCTVFEEGDETILVLVCIGTKGSRKELRRVELSFVDF